MPFGFSPARRGEEIVFGAERPGYPATTVPDEEVEEWVAFMKGKGIQLVCCLLAKPQLDDYTDLLGTYRSHFGVNNVLLAPVEDGHLCDLVTLRDRILPFLANSDLEGKKAVVHCSAGSGRTGLVMAAWLVHGRQVPIDDAIRTVEGMGRNPREAVRPGNATTEELHGLLEACRPDLPEETE